MKKILLLLVVLFFSCYCYSQEIHTFDEILKNMVNSKTKYEVVDFKDPVKRTDFSNKLNENIYYRVETGSKIDLKKIDLEGNFVGSFKNAENYFEKGQYDDAIENYEKAYKEEPNAHFLLTLIGQCHALKKDFDEAAKYYKLAIKNNYIDYMAHWFLADIYAGNRNYKDAVREITLASILNRNNPRIFKSLKSIYDNAGIKWLDFQFTPQMTLQKIKEDSIVISFDLNWLVYAMIKAYWKCEPGYKESMGVTGDDDLSMVEEREALANEYYSLKKKNTDLKDKPDLLILEKAIEGKMLDEFIVYEIMLLKHPIAAYTLPKATLELIADYVIKIRSAK